MNGNNTHITYSAADIRRYLNGKMNRDEMYALEKQAAEDPFLADAIEGYTGITLEAAETDLALIREQLGNSGKQEAKVVPMKQPGGFKWWKQGIAAAVAGLVIFGAATLLKGKKDEESKIASVTPAENTAPVNDTTKTASIEQVSETPGEKKAPSKTIFISPDSLSRFYEGEISTAPGTTGGVAASQPQPVTDNNYYKADGYVLADSVVNKVADEGVAWSKDAKREAAKPAAPPPPAPLQTEKNLGELEKESKPEAVVVQNQNRAENNGADRRSRGIEQFNNNEVTVNAASAPKKKMARQETRDDDMLADNLKQRNQKAFLERNFTFNYRVTDSKGNSIPYTNIAIPADQLVTYARADGSFGLFSADSVLRVQFKAAGYEPKSFLLRNNTQTTTIALNEEVAFRDKNMVVVGEQKNFAIRKKADKSVTDEAEPLDGWVTYDSYLANNIDAANKTKGVVELSFELNKKGEITGVTVEKSLGEKEDQEAIRLLTQGPKWKGKKKRSKGRVMVTF